MSISSGRASRRHATSWAALGVVALVALAIGWQAREAVVPGSDRGIGSAAPVEAPSAAPAAGAPAPARLYDLSDDERRGGHTLARHVGLTDDDLRERLRREPGIRAASTYLDRETAERVVAAVTVDERDRIERWSNRPAPRPNLALDYRGRRGEPLGRSLGRGQRTPTAAIDAVVVLRALASPRSGGPDYFVLTSYPEVRR